MLRAYERQVAQMDDVLQVAEWESGKGGNVRWHRRWMRFYSGVGEACFRSKQARSCVHSLVEIITAW